MSFLPLFRKCTSRSAWFTDRPAPNRAPPQARNPSALPPPPPTPPTPPDIQRRHLSPHLGEKRGLGDTPSVVDDALSQPRDEQLDGAQPPHRPSCHSSGGVATSFRHKSLPSLPSDVWMMVCDLLEADTDPRSRCALVSFMRTSSWAYHVGARSLYRTIEIGPDFLRIVGDLQPATQWPIKPSGEGRWCSHHGGWCAADDSWSCPSSIPAPIGKLALLRYTRTLIIGDVSKIDNSAIKALIDRLGARTRAHSRMGPDGVSAWIGRRPAVFGRVCNVRITVQGYFTPPGRWSAVVPCPWRPPPDSLLIQFLSTEAAPQTLQIEQPSLSQLAEILRGKHEGPPVNISDPTLVSALRDWFPDGSTPPWATDLGRHWSLEPSTVHSLA